MKKIKNWTVEKKDKIEYILIGMWRSLGIDIPNNYEDIVQDCYEDVCETADPINWHSGDVAIAFRRWIEAQTKKNVCDKPECPYKKVFNINTEMSDDNVQNNPVLIPVPEQKTQIWNEIRNDFQDIDIVHIDGYLTDDDNEEGQVIAKVNVRTKEVEYLDDRARTDNYAQEMIKILL